MRSLLLIAAAVLSVVPAALAVEMPSGSKNFTPPREVPNYFSNESGSFNGGAGVRSVPAFATPSYSAPSRYAAPPRYAGERRHAAVARRVAYAPARGRLHLARRGRVVLRQAVLHRAPHRHGRPVAARRVARAGR